MFSFSTIRFGALGCLCLASHSTTRAAADEQAARAESSPLAIAFASHRDGNWEIYAMGAGGESQTRLTNRSPQDRFALWSPDRSQIAFGSQRPDGWDLWVMDANGVNQRQLFSNIVAKGAR